MEGIRIAGGSVPGTLHTKVGQPAWTNNQDAFAWSDYGDGLVAVVCDGCGSSSHSELGARIGAHIVSHAVASSLRLFDYGLPIENVLADAHLKSLMQLKQVAEATPGLEPEDLLFTIMGVFVTPDETAVFSVGDGVFAVNGEVTIIPEYPGNAPPYIAYALDRLQKGLRIDQEFDVRMCMPTSEMKSVLIGSDGVADFIESEDVPVGREHKPLGPLSEFWTDEKFVTNPDMIRRRLARANVERVEDGRIKHGVLADDTTLVVIRRDEPQTRSEACQT